VDGYPVASEMADDLHDAEVIEDAPEEERLDPELAARRAAALAHVRKFGDPVLRSKARPIEVFDDALREEVARMATLMHDSMGIGLAATQLGTLHRVLVYRVEHDSPVNALINPELEWTGKEKEWMEEGCLSLPGVHVDVERPVNVRVRARNPRGEEISVEASGLEARVIQHEMDHLDGVLILDRTPRDQRKGAMRALREQAEAAA
jgi:peptide deformylase